jgi:hypothetical protein
MAKPSAKIPKSRSPKAEAADPGTGSVWLSSKPLILNQIEGVSCIWILKKCLSG